VTRASLVTAQLFSPKRVKLYTWRFSVRAGRSIVSLRLPAQVRRPGVYTIRWTARSGRSTVSRRITIRFVGPRTRLVQPVRVLLAGPAADGVRGKFSSGRPKVVLASGIEPTFDAAASRSTDVRVIVVDVNQFGVGMVRDLHAVFPAAKIVALVLGPKQMAAALKAGAAIALPRSTPAPLLARIIQRLLNQPVRVAKPRSTGWHLAH
ncbi:MAG: hypothetical protein QOD85_2136, partial [Gaiellaceae bacterium]|nr:hypothetical protein [Gaiellaceae bacterium]